MLIPKANRKAIYTRLFQEGVLIAEKDFNAPAHSELAEIPNLQVIKACQSLNSRGYVKEQFAWRHYYWYLTDEGLEYLRTYLHLPAEVVPNTHKQPARPTARPGRAAARPAASGFRGAADSYRRDEGKVGGAGPGFQPQFKGSYGRGASM
ncbi:uncharacterized protein MONBRDRAFT_34624 [Monosiga brevicollis MX1]|uniref:Plectin/eS10 N-terminal domain-containing protein n=1 Tax=Monosiga brevicollis TaxID=81824 RepID=A9VCY5_MONBE|nr:uncharacterized protein MONBRDRAFT_34624 [Monosiga brevicollis MX1]EDQ84549.1 predicted protein [Monosiga brevicollis MX1]|eukprot:XP_001750576.1 hypothetical protein [Monosiga brevicollis MX1]